MNEQKLRLEEELRFLKESLEAEVITEEEYEKGKQRIEKKISELSGNGITKEPEKQEPIKTEPTQQSEPQKEPAENEVQKEPENLHKEKEDIQTKTEEKQTNNVGPSETHDSDEKSVTKKLTSAIVILVILALFYFLVRGCTSDNIEDELTSPVELEQVIVEPIEPEEVAIVCSSDSECSEEGKIGTCTNPGSQDSVCEFIEPVETNLMVINDDNCIACKPGRMLQIVKEFFPGATVNYLDYNSNKNIISDLGINVLPAYVFDSNVGEALEFDNFKRALIKIGDNYIIKPTASGSNYFFQRPLIVNKVDLFILPGKEEDIRANIQEVFSLFNGKINFTEHIIDENEKNTLKEELFITTYPTFLVNNQVKFSGILPPNTIKEKICEVNYLEECKEELSKSIKL